MTLTAVLPSLRRSLPDPLDHRLWPEHTVTAVDDVIVGAVSLVRLAQWEGTPCVMTGDLYHPKARDVRARGVGTDVTVVVMRVVSLDEGDDRHGAAVDAQLAALPARWGECRLIGRVSTARPRPVDLLGAARDGASLAQLDRTASATCCLPGDLREGDLLAVPCAGAVSLHDVRARPVGTDITEVGWRCGK